MNDTPILRPGPDRRTKAQRAREWKREMDALTPAEKSAWELLPYSEIPEPGQARDIVAAVRPLIWRDCATYLRTIGETLGQRSTLLGDRVRYDAVVEAADWLDASAAELERGNTDAR